MDKLRDISGIAGTNGSQKVQSGLRPKPKVKSQQIAGQDTSQSSSSSQPVAFGSSGRDISVVNPLDRLCDLLLPWSLIDDVVRGSSRENKAESVLSSDNKQSQLLPNVFEDYLDYVTRWEPLLIEEIKANTLSNLTQNTRDKQRSGTVNVALAEDTRRSKTVKLDCTFNESQPLEGLRSNYEESSNRFKKEMPMVMDLILISKDPIQQPLNSVSLSRLSTLRSCLALVTSNRRQNESKGMQMKISRESWERLQVVMLHTQDTAASNTSVSTPMQLKSADIAVQPLSKLSKLEPITKVHVINAPAVGQLPAEKNSSR